MTDLEITQEAERLVGLNEEQVQTEIIATALRLGRQSDKAFDDLQQIDREFLNALTERGTTTESFRNENESEIVTV